MTLKKPLASIDWHKWSGNIIGTVVASLLLGIYNKIDVIGDKVADLKIKVAILEDHDPMHKKTSDIFMYYPALVPKNLYAYFLKRDSAQ